MKADPFAQLKLLDVQELDARADHLRHLTASLPELAEHAAAQTERRLLEDAIRDARIVVDDLAVEQAKVDADVEQVKARRTRDQERMDAGLIPNPKDLERMQHELASLQRRITSLEDSELEVMERQEEATGHLATLEAQAKVLDERIAALASARDLKLSELGEKLAETTAQRGPLVADLPADLLALYERLRESKGGVGAAALRARACGGCQLTLDNAELAQIKAAGVDEVIRCEECQRILVRTSESGL